MDVGNAVFSDSGDIVILVFHRWRGRRAGVIDVVFSGFAPVSSQWPRVSSVDLGSDWDFSFCLGLKTES